MVYGTDNGVYLSNLRDKAKVPVKVISVSNVTQLDVLEEQGILIVLAGEYPVSPRCTPTDHSCDCRQGRADVLCRQPRSRGRRRSSKTSSQDLFPRDLLQSRSMPRTYPRLHRQVGIRVEYDQDARTDRSSAREEATCAPQVLAGHRFSSCLQSRSLSPSL
jgi:hypothetical protein